MINVRLVEYSMVVDKSFNMCASLINYGKSEKAFNCRTNCFIFVFKQYH